MNMENSRIKLRERIISILLIAVMLLPTLLNTISLAEGIVIYDGSGTAEDPYQIKTVEQLQNLKNSTGAKFYKLMNDLDMSTVTDFEPIGTQAVPFQGSLDGDGHKISNLNIESSLQYVGLFGYASGGTIKNLQFENLNVKGIYAGTATAYIGGLAGYTTNVTIENVQITGTSNIIKNTTATTIMGGLIGNDSSTINNVKISGTVKVTDVEAGDATIGGMIGNKTSGTVSDCYVEAEISTKAKDNTVTIGGLIGSMARTY